jgi:regulator of protease activity HflC (stomatin/prohibitin superfamily)
MALIAIAIWLVVLGMVLMRRFLGWPTTVTLLPYQRGTLYRKGYPVRDVDPGRVRAWAGIEKVIIVDTRNMPVSFENRAVTLADGQTAIFGFSGSAVVSDARKALYSAQNFSHVPAYVLVVCSRAVLNRRASADLKIGQSLIEAEISKQAKLRLAAQGFNLLSFRITQLSIAGPPPQSDSKPMPTANA